VLREVAQELGIDTEFVVRDLDFHRGIGRGYLSQLEKHIDGQRWETVAFAATAFRRAGSHALLLDKVELATELFGDSAKCYETLRRPYAAMMWSLARNLQSAGASSERSLGDFTRSEGRYPSEQFSQLAYPLLIEAAIGFEKQYTNAMQDRYVRFRRVGSELTAFSTTPVGMMGIPTANYLSLAAKMEEEANPHDVQYYLLPFLNAYEVAVETARSRRYHWSRLLLPFHPVETDILSVLTTSNIWFKRHKLKLSDFIRARAESRLASKLLSDALETVGE
jgi:hypothetical protein